MSRNYLRIIELNYVERKFYPLGFSAIENAALRDIEFESTPEEAPDSAPRTAANRLDYEWRLEMLEPSGMVGADKSISYKTVENILGCSVEAARESARDEQKFELHLSDEEWARMGWA